MSILEKIKTLESSVFSARDYVEESKTKLSSNNFDDIKLFRDELWEFIRLVRETWLLTESEHKQDMEELQAVYNTLRQNEIMLAKRMVEIQKDHAILKKIDDIALPEDVQGVASRDFSKWAVWPLRYSPRLRTKLSTAKLPQ